MMSTRQSNESVTDFNKVEALAKHVVSENKDREIRTGVAITVVTAYLIACDRALTLHHFDDAPTSTVWAEHRAPSDEVLDAQQAAYDAVWEVVGPCGTVNDRYSAAWDVWSAMLNYNENIPGMDRD